MDDLSGFHKIFGIKNARINYNKNDFLDYALMNFICALAIYFSYGLNNVMTIMGLILCGYMVIAFLVRHGLGLKVPLIIRRPHDILYMFIYKIINIKLVYIFALSILLLENYIISITPGFPHKVEIMKKIAIYLFYTSFLLISLYRTVILVAHLRKRNIVKDVLLQSSWKGVVIKSNVTFEIVHAYLTGVLTHIIMIAPWYIVIHHFQFSAILLPVVFILNILTHIKFYKIINSWFYRDHWLGHNSELEFLYLHGTHHDAIPSGLIGVAGNGYLEGYLRQVMGYPNPFYNPIVSFLLYSSEIKKDIEVHQYIPGIFPQLPLEFQEVSQHSTHHFGKLQPYGFAVKLDQPNVADKIIREFAKAPEELKNSAKLDEDLGFEWNNARYKWYLDLVKTYKN